MGDSVPAPYKLDSFLKVVSSIFTFKRICRKMKLRCNNSKMYFKPLRILQESTTGEIGKECSLKKIDGNNRKPTGNNAIPIEAGNALQRECFGMYQNHSKKSLLIRHQFPANPLESRDSTFCIGK